MSQLIELTYISEPAQSMSFLGLMRLLYHSYLKNQGIDITGVLIFDDNRFGQVIEVWPLFRLENKASLDASVPILTTEGQLKLGESLPDLWEWLLVSPKFALAKHI